jgi:DNA-binding response OmpR family regulator
MQTDSITSVAKGARILIVDDMAENAEVLGRILRRAGYAISITMTDSADALAKFADLQPDLVILDWYMEPISGLEFIEELRNRFPAETIPPILVITADTSAETCREALAVGAADFLSKPFDLSEVLLRIRNLLRIRSLQRRIRDLRDEAENGR